MDEFKVGEIKKFKVLGIREDHEVKWIYLSDGVRETFRVKPFDYQLEWEPSNLPDMMECYVKNISIRGLPLLHQVKKNVLTDCYTDTNEEYPFKLRGVHEDPNSGATYYDLKDVYGLLHRYYPGTTEPVREIGTIFNLRFTGITVKERNNAYLDLLPVEQYTAPPQTINPDPVEEHILGFEDESREFKSSIVYPAGGIAEDIDQQLLIISKTIAGFQNHNGGELFLGVNDAGQVIGIEHELKYLNSSEKDNFTYQDSIDHYQLKIRNSVKFYLGNTANNNLSFSFPTLNGLTYCLIKINKVSRPVFLNNTKLFQRAGNMTQLLKGDEITHFIEERYTKRNNFAFPKPVEDKVNLEELPQEEEIPEEVKKEVQVSSPALQVPEIPVVKKDKIWNYLTFYKDGCWSYQSKSIDSDEVELELPIMNSLKKERLLMVYENGRMNVVIPYDVCKSGKKMKKKGRKYMNGWNRGSKLLDVFSAKTSDLVVFNSSHSDGTKWVKAHNVGAISVHGQLYSEGNVLVNSNLEAKLNTVSPLPLEYYHLISSIVLKDTQTSGYLGFKSTDKILQKTFKTLEQLKKEYRKHWKN